MSSSRPAHTAPNILRFARRMSLLCGRRIILSTGKDRRKIFLKPSVQKTVTAAISEIAN